MHERQTWQTWIVLWLLLSLQTTVLARWQPFGSHIDLPLLCVVSVALLLGWEFGAVYGLVAGVLTGYCAAFHVGSFAVSRAAVGGVFGLFDRRFSRDNPLAPPICAAGAVLLSNLVYGLMSPDDFIYWGATSHGFSFWWWAQRTLLSMLVHAVLIWPVHALIARFVQPPARPLVI
jgi:hypothetical protein